MTVAVTITKINTVNVKFQSSNMNSQYTMRKHNLRPNVKNRETAKDGSANGNCMRTSPESILDKLLQLFSWSVPPSGAK